MIATISWTGKTMKMRILEQVQNTRISEIVMMKLI